jgi:hypothetical protein
MEPCKNDWRNLQQLPSLKTRIEASHTFFGVLANSNPILTGTGSVFNLAGTMDEPIVGLMPPGVPATDEVFGPARLTSDRGDVHHPGAQVPNWISGVLQARVDPRTESPRRGRERRNCSPCHCYSMKISAEDSLARLKTLEFSGSKPAQAALAEEKSNNEPKLTTGETS